MQITRQVRLTEMSVTMRARATRAPTAVAGLLLLAVTAPFAGADPARTSDCSIAYRELAGVQGLPQVREHVCVVKGSGTSQTLRVTFARLDETLAGNLARSEKTPEFDRLFGSAMLVENDISAELKVLFQNYAHKITVPARNMEMTVTVSTPRGVEALDTKSATLPPLDAGENETRRLWSISSSTANFDAGTEYGISLDSANRVILNDPSWPAGFKQFYICQEEAIQCTKIWRYVEQVSELDAIERDTDRMIRAAQTPQDRREDQRRDKSDWNEDHSYIHKTHFSLFRHLAEGGWPAHFIVVGAAMECLGGFEGKYVMPTLALDVAIVENASFAPVRILDLVGVLGKTRGLRAATAAADTSAAPLHIGEIQVAPGGKVIIPLRITFFAGIANGEPWGSMSDARKMYQRIASKPASAIFTLTSRRTKPPVVFRKAKSSFGPPELPESTEYRFGAELQLSGFFVDTSGFNLDHTEPNLVTLYGGDTGNDDSTDQPDPGVQLPEAQEPDVELRLHQNLSLEGSCPILYVWDAATGEWVNRGKVIHTANGDGNESTSVIRVNPNARRFRLAEEELEAASVRRAQLVLTLRNGRRVAVDPDESDGARFPRKIHAYTSVSFNYSVPEAFASTDIERAELAVTGFYTRYSAIMASRLFKANARSQRPPR